VLDPSFRNAALKIGGHEYRCTHSERSKLEGPFQKVFGGDGTASLSPQIFRLLLYLAKHIFEKKEQSGAIDFKAFHDKARGFANSGSPDTAQANTAIVNVWGPQSAWTNPRQPFVHVDATGVASNKIDGGKIRWHNIRIDSLDYGSSDPSLYEQVLKLKDGESRALSSHEKNVDIDHGTFSKALKKAFREFEAHIEKGLREITDLTNVKVKVEVKQAKLNLEISSDRPEDGAKVTAALNHEDNAHVFAPAGYLKAEQRAGLRQKIALAAIVVAGLAGGLVSWRLWRLQPPESADFAQSAIQFGHMAELLIDQGKCTISAGSLVRFIGDAASRLVWVTAVDLGHARFEVDPKARTVQALARGLGIAAEAGTGPAIYHIDVFPVPCCPGGQTQQGGACGDNTALRYQVQVRLEQGTLWISRANGVSADRTLDFPNGGFGRATVECPSGQAVNYFSNDDCYIQVTVKPNEVPRIIAAYDGHAPVLVPMRTPTGSATVASITTATPLLPPSQSVTAPPPPPPPVSSTPPTPLIIGVNNLGENVKSVKCGRRTAKRDEKITCYKGDTLEIVCTIGGGHSGLFDGNWPKRDAYCSQ
jgi:hypothetical protein